MTKDRVNLHIFASDVVNETRLFKEARYTLREAIFDRVIVCGLWAEGLPRRETMTSGLLIQRVPTWIRQPRLREFLGRVRPLYALVAALSLLQYSVVVLAQAKKIRPSHLSCHNVSLLPLSVLAAWISGARLVYLPHELETERASTSGKRQKIERWIESNLIHKASQVVVVCEPIAQWYAEHYDLETVHVIRNMPEQGAVDRKDIGRNAFRSAFEIEPSATVFIYQGVMGPARGTSYLLDVFSKIPSDRAHLVLMGYADPATDAAIREATQRFSNIHYQPAVSADLITSYTASADVGLFITQEEALSYRFSLPNKFFEYVHAGLPVLLTDNLVYMSEILKDHGLGWTVPVDQIQSQIETISTGSLDEFAPTIEKFASDAVWESDAQMFHAAYE